MLFCTQATSAFVFSLPIAPLSTKQSCITRIGRLICVHDLMGVFKQVVVHSTPLLRGGWVVFPPQLSRLADLPESTIQHGRQLILRLLTWQFGTPHSHWPT